MALTNLSAAAPPCCLQLHHVRRPALLSPPCLPLRLPLHLRLRLRVRVRAQPSPSPDSFAGWSDGDGDDGNVAAPGTFGGLLGAGLAGAFFLAGLTFAAISFRTNTATGTRTQMETLSAQSEAAPHSTDSTCREGVSQVMLPSDSENGSSFDNESDRNKRPLPLDMNEISGEHAEQEQGMEHLSQSNNLAPHDVPHDVHVATDTLSKPDNIISSEGSESLASDPSMSNSVESVVVAYDSSHKLSGAGPSEGTPFQEERHFEVIENQQMDEILTSDITVIDSGDVSVQEIADTAVEAQSHPKEKDTEQNPELCREDDISQSGLPDYIEYGSVDQILPFVSNDLPTEGGMLGKDEETLGSDQHEGEIEIENETDFFKSTAPDTSFSSAGIPAPTLLPAALQVPAGQIVVPAAVDPTQGNALAALQVLKVIEPGAQAGDLCTRREYARWLVVASNCLLRNTSSKVYPAMYIENVTELAFDDITPKDPDFPFIQGLAEAGLISSKLSISDKNIPGDVQNNDNLFSPESPLSRQDLVSWKMALDKRHLPKVDKNTLYKVSGYIDIDKIHAAAWPAFAADLGAGDQSITALAFGFTRLLQPYKPVTKGQAALALSTGDSAEIVMEELARIEAEKIAEAAVNAHGALVAQVEKDLNASFERELTKEREKIETLERLAEEARIELDKLRAERDEEKNVLFRGRAAVESEMEVLSKLRCEVEEQLQSVLSKKVEISFEKNRIENLQKEIEAENQAVVQLQYELEVERKALSMARAWAEDEAKKAREHARALEEARNQWERQGIKVVVEGGLEDDASAGMTWANTGKEHPVDEAINRAESMLEKLKSMSAEMKVRSSHALERVMHHVRSFISSLKQQAEQAAHRCTDFGSATASKAKKLSSEAQGSVYAFGSAAGDKTKRLVEDCKEGLEKFAHRFKTD